MLRLVCRNWANATFACFEPDDEDLFQNLLKDASSAKAIEWYLMQPFCRVPDNTAMSLSYYGRIDCFHLATFDRFWGFRYVSLAIKGGHLDAALYLQNHFRFRLNVDEAQEWLENARKGLPAIDYEACKEYLRGFNQGRPAPVITQSSHNLADKDSKM